ncbi:MAG: C10 family peptidase [Muribaculaceae bacterium]
MLWKENTVNTISDVDNMVPQDTIEMYKKEWSAISPIARLQGASASHGVTRPTSRVDHWTDAPVFHSDFTREDYDRLLGIMADTIAELRGKGYTVETFEHLNYGDLIPGAYGEQGITINDLIQMCDGMTDIFYSENFRFLSFAAYKDEVIGETTGPYIQTKWDQEIGFNQCFPYDGSGKLCKVGCGTLAVGQLMRYFKKPDTYDWLDMPLTYATRTTSNFLLSIAKEMNASFELGKTGTTFPEYVKLLKKYYYLSTKENASNSDLKSIIDGRITLIAAVWKGEDNAHTWLSGGYSRHHRVTQNTIYTFTLPDEMTSCGNMEQETIYPSYQTQYMIWGFYGKYDGYYSYCGWHFPGRDDIQGTPLNVSVIYNFRTK